MELEQPLGDPTQYQYLKPPSDDPTAPGLAFQRVPEPKSGKNRVHLDIAVDDVEASTERIEELGGTRAPSDDFAEYGFRWRVMADPDGNETCLIYTSPD